MNTFKIEIQEFLSTIVEIEAVDKDDAISKIKDLYQKGEIVLDSNDFVTTEIKEYVE